MKLPNPESRTQNAESRHRQVSAFCVPHATFARAQRGMALIITLILLSVTLVMVVAFLAVSRRERASVTTTTDTTIARLAADTALAAAQAQIVANLRTTNASLYHSTILVSTNYINPAGFDNTAGPYLTSPVNVNYFYPNGTMVSAADFIQVVSNLQFLPRAPVLVNSSTRPDGTNQGRFYLDLNRNGLFEDTGTRVADVDGAGFTNGFITASGDPQWVGILERPGQTHAADNKFVSRYAFFAQPISESLDLNAIHNEAMTRAVQAFPNQSGVNEGFHRNQSVGSWELNLAAFLADLNTKQWNNPLTQPYQYFQPASPNRGFAFEDSLALLSYRYGYNYLNLPTLGNVLGNGNAGYLSVDQNDILSDGPPQTTTTNIDESVNPDALNFSWAGANNPQRIYRPGDLFDPTKSSGGVTGGFTNRLLATGNGVSTYDRYTFYRMLEQLGTDSTPANEGKLNLNYSNAVVRYDANGAFLDATIIPGAETNLVPWNPRDFFCAAADALLKNYTTSWFQADRSNYLATYYGITGNAANYYYQDFSGKIVTNHPSGYGLTNIPVFGITNQIPAFGLTNIPVLVNGQFQYGPAVNRLLQLAANIYEASTNDFYPRTYRPIFRHDGANVFIVGYEPVVLNTGIPFLASPTVAESLIQKFPPNSAIFTNVYDVPWIIGAKKYLPSFNSFYTYSQMQVVRKLQVSRAASVVGKTYNANTRNFYTTNQMILLGITNSIGLSFWNSYATNYSSAAGNYPYANPNITVFASDISQSRMSNGAVNVYSEEVFTHIVPNRTSWPGSGWDYSSGNIEFQSPSPSSFIYASTNITVLKTYSLLFNAAGTFYGFGLPAYNLPISVTPVFPAIMLYTTNLFQAYILDNGNVIDYVHLKIVAAPANLANHLKDPDGPYAKGVSPARRYMWSTNLDALGMNWGVQNQLFVSMNNRELPPGGLWTTVTGLPSPNPPNEAASFSGFFKDKYYFNGVWRTNLLLTNQAPYTPVRTVVSPLVYTINDPLVHYLTSDLKQNRDSQGLNGWISNDNPYAPNITPPGLSDLSERYQPWGRKELNNSITSTLNNSDESKYLLAIKDPLVYGSDNWSFPTNKYPSLGWLGRVHRGTPWQSVYLKATDILEYVDNAQANPLVGINTWATWSGNQTAFEATNSRPVADNRLFDIFTASPNANASRGLLPVNQTHLAAWSAVLSGMVVPTNLTNGYTVIDPAGVDTVNSIVAQIVNGTNGINLTRTNTALFPSGQFTKIGDVLRAPILSEQSPFLSGLNTQTERSDQLYEWLPQQMLGLLRAPTAPRFVVYAYGQTLKPAPDGTVLGSGVVTNYQVVAESAARAIITVTPQVVMTNAFGPVTNYSTRVENFNALPPE